VSESDITKKRRKQVSSIDVAKKAGVSQATVSRVFSAGSSVSERLRKRVMSVADELGYYPNYLSGGLSPESTRIIGIVNPNFESTFYFHALKYFTLELQRIDYTAMLLNIPRGGKVEDVLPLAFRYQVDGLITTSIKLTSPLIKACQAYSIPVVQFNRYSLGLEASSVSLDNIRAGREAARILIAEGHKKIAFLAGEAGSSTSKDRETGLLEELDQNGMKIHARFEGDYSYASGEEGAKEILGNSDKPDAVFCASDEMAFGFIDCAEKCFGLKVPDDVSVIGFDNSKMANSLRYNLTTFTQPVEAMVLATVEVMVDTITNPSRDVQIKLIPGELVSRGSVMKRKP
jgi:DNA-binding LacI/PurR family transcriptional regulator